MSEFLREKDLYKIGLNGITVQKEIQICPPLYSYVCMPACVCTFLLPLIKPPPNIYCLSRILAPVHTISPYHYHHTIGNHFVSWVSFLSCFMQI